MRWPWDLAWPSDGRPRPAGRAGGDPAPTRPHRTRRVDPRALSRVWIHAAPLKDSDSRLVTFIPRAREPRPAGGDVAVARPGVAEPERVQSAGPEVEPQPDRPAGHRGQVGR